MISHLAFQFGYLSGKLFVGKKNFAQSDESADNKNAHPDCARRIQNAGRHDRSMFCEHMGEIFPVLTSF